MNKAKPVRCKPDKVEFMFNMKYRLGVLTAKFPMVTSGVRLGSPAGTTRGFGVAEFQEVGRLITEVLDGLSKNGEAGNGAVEAAVKAKAIALCDRFPIYA